MKSIQISLKRNLFGDTEITLFHEAMSEPMLVSHPVPEDAIREVERLLVVHLKITLRKYLTVFRKSKGVFLAAEDQKTLEGIEVVISRFTRRMRLQTIQTAITPLLPELEALLPAIRSRFFPSQRNKLCFIGELTSFELEAIERIIAQNAKTDKYV